jgi:hypothetical protein
MESKKQFPFWLTVEDHKQLKIIAAQKETSIASIVTGLVHDYLKLNTKEAKQKHESNN